MSSDQPPADPAGEGERDVTVAPTGEPRRVRRHRRATGGTARPAEPVVPADPARSPDDQDTGWGERPAGDDDDRLRREVPPHW